MKTASSKSRETRVQEEKEPGLMSLARGFRGDAAALLDRILMLSDYLFSRFFSRAFSKGPIDFRSFLLPAPAVQ